MIGFLRRRIALAPAHAQRRGNSMKDARDDIEAARKLPPLSDPSVPSPPAAQQGPLAKHPINVWPGYERLARTPQSYAGWTLLFRGNVVQVMQQDNEGTILRVDVNIPPTFPNEVVPPDQYAYGRNHITYVDYRASPSEPRIFEGDLILIHAKFVGIKSYTTVLGNMIQIPHATACGIWTPNFKIGVWSARQPCEPSH